MSAWATESGLILGQQAVADGSHEITAIPELLTMLDLKKSILTIDAAGCQTAIVEQIRAQGGDYLIAVKGNQPELLAAVEAVVERASLLKQDPKRGSIKAKRLTAAGTPNTSGRSCKDLHFPRFHLRLGRRRS